MHNKKMINKIMHFLVHNGFIVTVAVMGLVHATLLAVMWAGGVMPLVNLNILSVVVYLFCVLFCRFGHIMPVYVSIFLEVTVYAVISVYFVGWECASCCFLCSIVPIIIFYLTCQKHIISGITAGAVKG